jgi:hypothetical protein
LKVKKVKGEAVPAKPYYMGVSVNFTSRSLFPWEKKLPVRIEYESERAPHLDHARIRITELPTRNLD